MQLCKTDQMGTTHHSNCSHRIKKPALPDWQNWVSTMIPSKHKAYLFRSYNLFPSFSFTLGEFTYKFYEWNTAEFTQSSVRICWIRKTERLRRRKIPAPLFRKDSRSIIPRHAALCFWHRPMSIDEFFRSRTSMIFSRAQVAFQALIFFLFLSFTPQNEIFLK